MSKIIQQNNYTKYIKNNSLGIVDDNFILLEISLPYTTIGNYSLCYAYSKNKNIKKISFPNLTTVNNSGMRYCFAESTSPFEEISFPNLTTIGNYSLQGCFSSSSLSVAPTFSSLTNVGTCALDNCFASCTSLRTPPTFASVTSSGQSGFSQCFYGCTSLTTAPTFANLTTINDNGLMMSFYGCTSLTTAPTFSNLTSMTMMGLYNCFYNCTSLTGSITFTKLNSIGMQGLASCFYNTKITSLSFPALTSTSFGSYTNQFNSMLSRVTGCTVHFPSNLQSVIGSWSDVTRGFGGTNTTVLFDLPATT
jgi:hypothetical protein